MIGYVQVNTAFGGVFSDVPWPDIFTKWTEITEVINIDLVYLVDFQCVNNSLTFYSTFLWQVMGPIFASLSIFFFGYCRIFCCGMYSTKDRKRVWIQHVQVFLGLIFVTYPSVCNTILTLYNCQEVDNGYFLAVDLRVQCYIAEWNNYAAFGAICVLVYPVGVPAFFVLALYWHRQFLFPNRQDDYRKLELELEVADALQRMEDPACTEQERSDIEVQLSTLQLEVVAMKERAQKYKDVVSKYGFVYSSYSEHAYWWELTELVRKLLLTGVVIFVAPGSLSQLAFAFLVNLFFFVLHINVDAFVERAESKLMFYSLLSTLITVFSGIILKGNHGRVVNFWESAMITGVLMTSNFAMGIIFVYIIILMYKAYAAPNMAKTTGSEETKPFEEAFDDTMLALNLVFADKGEFTRAILPILGVFEREAKDSPSGIYAENGMQSQLVSDLQAALEYKEDPLEAMRHVMEVAQAFGGVTMTRAITDAFVRMAKNDIDEVAHIAEFAHDERESKLNSCENMTASGVGEDEGLWTEENLSQAKVLFERYDLDHSGTVNSWEEAQQITFNLLYSFGMTVSRDEAENRMSSLVNVAEESMNFDQYWLWFHTTFSDQSQQPSTKKLLSTDHPEKV